MYSVHSFWTTNWQSGSRSSAISELNVQPLSGAMAVHDDDLRRAGRLRAANGGVDLLRVELAPLLVQRLAAARLLPLHDAGDALHVRDDVDAHASSVRRIETGLHDKGVLVTGASSGIGAACASAFTAEGARVVVHYHLGEKRALDVADAIGAVAVAQADLRVEADVDRLFEEARAALGTVDVCAAVAGVYPSEDVPLWELSLERWEETAGEPDRDIPHRPSVPARGRTHRAWLARPRRLDRRRLRRARARGLRGREVGHPRRPAAVGEERGAARVCGARERGRPRLDDVSHDARSARRRERGADHANDAAPQGATAEDVAAQVVVLASDTLSGHVTGQVAVVAGGMEGRVVHPDKSEELT